MSKNLYHKIPGVPLTVCTAEQKIAYNAAFAADVNSDAREVWKSRAGSVAGVVRADFIADYVALCVSEIENSRDAETIKRKYNFDMIVSALRAGAKNYLTGGAVLWDYETIGKTFPALYLKTL